MFYTYVLKCGDGDFYVGSTVDLRKRIAQHETNAVAQGWRKSFHNCSGGIGSFTDP